MRLFAEVKHDLFSKIHMNTSQSRTFSYVYFLKFNSVLYFILTELHFMINLTAVAPAVVQILNNLIYFGREKYCI